MTLNEIAVLMAVGSIAFIVSLIINKLFVVEVGAQPPCIEDKFRESEQKTHDLLVVLCDRIESIESKFQRKPKKKVGRPKKVKVVDGHTS
jgi:hypothetical protein